MGNDVKQWALKELDEMTRLQQDWDTYDANPISPVAIATASKLLQEAEERFGDIAYQQLLEVVPRPDGGVGVMWKQWPLEINVRADDQGNLGYLYIVFHQNAIEDYKEASNVSWDTVLALIDKVINVDKAENIMSDAINEITLTSQEVEQFLHLLFAGRVVSKEPLPEGFERTLYMKIFSVYNNNREAMFMLKVKGNEEKSL